MLVLDALIAQFEQRFQYEKRANICLWFDDKQEFLPLLPRLHSYLQTRDQQPFTLLQYEYDPDNKIYHGQIWLKHQIYSHLSAWHQNCKDIEKGASAFPPPRFVLYIPLSEDRLDSPDENGENHLDLLEEYRITGVTWRINGKRPTLFTFLRQAGIRLPDSPSDQRKLYEGGKDSLLARYAAKFLDQPRSFWETLLTPDLAQSRLVGDLEQTIFDLATAPRAVWKTLKEKGLDTDFVEAVSDRYSFAASTDDPDAWIAEFVAILALTETYLGYTGQSDSDRKAHTSSGSYDQATEAFPFGDRLPPHTARQDYLRLLRRWLRDTQSRPAWDRWIGQVETSIDLSQWASEQPGLAFGFPHLVRQRWEKILSAFEAAANKISTTRDFFDRHRATIAREVEFSKASETAIGAWALLQDLDALVTACITAEEAIKQRDNIPSLVTLYVDQSPQCDRLHLKVRFETMQQMLPTVGKVADRHYASYTKALNQKFFNLFLKSGSTDIPNLPLVTHRFDQQIWQAKGKRAVIIVDALRYDCAYEIQSQLSGQQVNVEPVRAQLPTVTSMGMTALMPLQNAQLGIKIHNGKLQPLVNGKDMSVRSNRLAYLTEFGADCREIGDLEKMSTLPTGLGDLLVVFGHEQVDSIGHDEGDTLIRHLYIEIERLVLLVRKLHLWGYQTVHIVTDHGFVLLDEEQLPPEVKCNPEWCKLLKERFAIVAADVDLPELHTLPCEWESSLRVAVPPGLAFFKTEKSFSHGGATLQELVIPHLTSRVLLHQTKQIQVEVVLPKYELVQTVAKVILRGRAGSNGQLDQMTLFPEPGRTINLDVLREEGMGKRRSVLAGSKPKSVQLEAGKEESVTLFFHSSLNFNKGELLSLEIWDAETLEKFPPGGIKLTMGIDR